MNKPGAAKKYRKYFRASFLSRILIIALVVAAEALAVHLYNTDKDLFQHLSWNTIAQADLPSWRYELASHPQAAPPGQTTQSVPVLVYHGLISSPDQSNTLIKDFRAQMFALKAAGYHTISMDDYVAFMQGKRTLPAKSFLLTFDDGRKDSYYNADPILKALGYRATMFVIAYHAFDQGDTSTYYLNKGELQNMVRTGRWDIEAHSYDGHNLMQITKSGKSGDFYSNYLWLKDKGRLENKQEYQTRVGNDLTKAKQELQDNLHIKVNAFAYPFGDYGQGTMNNPQAITFVPAQVKKLYAVAFAQEGVDNTTTQNYYGTGGAKSTRLEPSYDWTAANLITMMDIGTGKSLPYTDTFSDISGWTNDEGAYTLDGSGMSLHADPTNTSTGVLLDGSQTWRNYTYTADLQWQAGQNVTLIGRYQDAKNYVACSFSTSFTTIRQTKNGVVSTLQQLNHTLPPGKTKLALSLRGNQISCGANGTQLISANANAAPEQGMIGLNIYDPTKGLAQIDVTRVAVEPAH
jgi:peptidoglycan/xylan/chitin deacetylase (PgdA/CDA1 family)